MHLRIRIAPSAFSLLAMTPSLAWVPRAHALDQPIPGLLLGWPSGLANRACQIGHFLLDLLARQQVQATDQDGSLDHRRLGAVEAFERGVRGAVHHAAMKPGPLRVLGDGV